MDDDIDTAEDTAGNLAGAALLEDLEERYMQVIEERDSFREQLDLSKAELQNAQEKLSEQQAARLQASQQLQTIKVSQQQLDASNEEKKHLMERNDRLQAESDNLREEITRLLASNKELNQEVASAETQAKLTESDAIPLFHANERLQRELESIQSHADWLNQELDAKQQDYQHLQTQSRDRTIQLQLQLDQTRNDYEAVNATLTVQEKMERELQDKLQTLSRENLGLKQEVQEKQETFEKELQDKDILIAMQKDHMVRWEKRCEDVIRENENLQKTAQEALAASDKELEDAKEAVKAKYTALLEEQASEFNSKLRELKSPGVGERILLESADAVEDEKEDEGPLNMTELYERLEKTKAALRETKKESNKWELWYTRLVKEVREKTPEMIRMREEFEMAVTQNQDLEQRLDFVIQERDDAQADAKDARQEASALEKRLAEREVELRSLAEQVQALLISRSGGSHDITIPVTVKEIQSQNQRLLAEHRHLTNQVEELEERLQTDVLKKKLDATAAEVYELKKQQKEQEVFVEKIVDQRDLYRALLNKSDSKALGSESDELTALEMVKQQSENAKRYEHLNMELEGRLKATQSELDSAIREKEGFEERVHRFEAVNADLLQKTGTLERDLISARREVARREADASYHKEKCEQIEESLDRARQEISKVSNSRSDFQKINADLQRTISEAQAERSRLESEKRQLEAKFRLIETQLATAKSAEAREAEENRQLRSEVARQGVLIDSVRRIDASLSAKSETEKENLKSEIESLTRKLEIAEKKYAADTENLKTRAEEASAQIQDLQSSSQKHQADSLKSKKEALEAKMELQTLKSKLKATEAQLRAAKRKLGDGDDIEDVELTLQNRIDTLEGELRTARDEIISLKESSENYQRLAKSSEDALNELKETAKKLKESKEQELSELLERLEASNKANLSKQELVRTLTMDLSKEKDDHEKQKTELQSQIEAFKTEIKDNAKDVESARASDAALKHDIQTLRDEVNVAQNNYERELALHSEARSALRAAQETAEEESRMRVIAENKFEVIQKELSSQSDAWEQEKAAIEDSKKLLEKSIQDARDQNKVLHEQLETLNSMIEKSRSASVSTELNEDADAPGDSETQKLLRELRELVKFLRAENELIQTELDTAKRGAEREKASANVVRRSLDEARAELEVLRSRDEDHQNAKETGGLKDVVEKLRVSEEQLNLLKDSNKLLREETLLLRSKLSETQEQFEDAKKSALPTESVQRELGTKIAILEAEKESLARELESWKGRMTSLVSNFNQIDPEEHRKLSKQVEEMTKEKISLNAWKKTTEEESNRLRNICKKLKEQLQEQVKLVGSLNLKVERMSAEKEFLEKKSAASSTITKEREELRKTIAEMEKVATSKQVELEGQTSMNQRLRDKLREYQSLIRSLKEQQSSVTAPPAPTKPSSPKPSDDKGAAVTAVATTKAPEKLSTTATSGKDEKAPAAETLSAKDSEEKSETPQVPPGGFKFGPSERKQDGDEKKLQSHPQSLRATAPSFVPDAPKLSSTQKAPPPAPVAKPLPPLQSVPTEATKPGGKGAGALPIPEGLAAKRLSGEKRELSMKEKLLEKKRQLLEAQKRKQEAIEAAKGAGSSSPEGHRAKKLKSEKPPLSTPPAATGTTAQQGPPKSPVPVEKDEGLALESEAATKSADESKASEDSSAPEGKIDAEPSDKSGVDTGKGTSSEERSSEDVKEGENAQEKTEDVETEEDDEDEMQATEVIEVEEDDAGEGATPGEDAKETEAKPEAEKPKAPMHFFGASPFGPATAPSAPTTFGQSTSTVKPGSFGSSFLNIKPPGSSGTPPTFTFGSSGSIMLPTPSLPTAPGPFGAFYSGMSTVGFGAGMPSSSPFGGMQARPLFGDPPKEEDENNMEDEDENQDN